MSTLFKIDSFKFSKLVLLTAFPLLLATGCVSGGDGSGGQSGSDGGGGGDGKGDSPSEDTGGDPVASTDALWLPGKGRLDIMSLERVDDETAVLHYRLTNNSQDGIRTLHLFTAEDDSDTTTDVTLIDVGNKKQYFPWNSQSGECYCSEITEKYISPGDTMDFWSAFPAPPEDVSTVSVATPISGPLHGIEVTDGGKAPEGAPGSMDKAKILDVRGFSEELSTGTSREESGEETAVMLSSDVLFDLNESDLKPEAQEILEQVADEINNSSAETVKIDGHTDDSGNDSINIPLSEERAESVESELEKLVTRSGVSFETEGHGSTQPVADNGTDEGAQKNRRVTVTFEK